ncbi:AP-4 complex accessory subunit Tepsin-like [Penaeus japonicus]|uniref:AP-4 complex accessory subunit Tepsin-like n=1 Tax=Penaeus japonicus TaxID=27405 RepID=UPI001C712D95|nr:AP-4 complex accessory subunit Tepsin-like [Penaeus japonicus]
MDLLKEAKNVVDFATYYPLLNKATIDNDTPTPGYLFEDIIKLSHQSQGHRHHLVDFLIARLQISSWPGKQKVVRILHQTCSRGHRGVRVYLRGKDGDLRKAAASGGPPDPVLANTPQLFLSSAIQVCKDASIFIDII